MNIVIWMLAGASLGWMSYSYLGLSEGRGMFASVIIGAVGGVLGGKVIAPMLSKVAAVPADFSLSALLFAVAAAAGVLVIGNLVHKRWGV